MHRTYHDTTKWNRKKNSCSTHSRDKKTTLKKTHEKKEQHTTETQRQSSQEQTENKRKNKIDKYQGWKSIITIAKCLCLVNTISNNVIIWPTQAQANEYKLNQNSHQIDDFQIYRQHFKAVLSFIWISFRSTALNHRYHYWLIVFLGCHALFLTWQNDFECTKRKSVETDSLDAENAWCHYLSIWRSHCDHSSSLSCIAWFCCIPHCDLHKHQNNILHINHLSIIINIDETNSRHKITAFKKKKKHIFNRIFPKELN